MFRSLPVKRVNLLATACNLACPMCSMNMNVKGAPQILGDYRGASGGPSLTLDEYKAFFRGLRRDVPSVSIAGGEPLILKEVIPLIQFLTQECGFSVGVTTNGTLFDEEKTLCFAKSGASVTISIDGLKEKHDEIRGEGVFDKAIHFLNRLVELKRRGISNSKISSLFTLHQTNYTELPKVAVMLFDEIGIDGMTVSFLVFTSQEVLRKHAKWMEENRLSDRYSIRMRRGSGVDQSQFTSMDFRAIWDIKMDMTRRFPMLRFEPDFRSLEDLKTYFLTNQFMEHYFNRICNPCRNVLTLLSNGDVLFFPGCFEIEVGNVREKGAKEIWQGPVFREIRSILGKRLSPICSHCCANRKEKKL